MDDNVLQHNSLSLHLFSHIQHDSSNGWDNGVGYLSPFSCGECYI